MGLGALTLINPWLLLGLAAIPLIWLLLRFTPPSRSASHFLLRACWPACSRASARRRAAHGG